MDQALVLLNILVKSQNARPKFSRSNTVQPEMEQLSGRLKNHSGKNYNSEETNIQSGISTDSEQTMSNSSDPSVT